MIEQVDYKEKYEQASLEVIQLRHELAQLKKMIFGKKNERFIPSTPTEQLAIGLEVTAIEAPTPVIETIKYDRVKATSKKEVVARMQFPAELPREEVVLEPEEDVTGCVKIGEEVTEVLEMTPAKFYVRKTIRPKYARKSGDGIAIASLLSRVNPKGLLGTSIITQLLIDKFVDHLPVYRQQERFNRAGLKIPYSTLVDATHEGIKWMEVLYESLRQKIFATSYIHADETPNKVLDKNKKGTTHKGYYWVYYSPIERLVLFDYREGRGEEGPGDMLKTYTGYLQTDGYGVYDKIVASHKGIVHLACMAHARRNFVEARDNDQAKAEKALLYYQSLYQIEKELEESNADAETKLKARQEKAVPILKEMETWMQETYASCMPKSPIGKAIAYHLKRKEELTAYTQNGTLRIDNNLVENSIRPVALGRKNYLFSGSHEAAKRSAMIYSLLGCCKAHGINPEKWLKYILDIIPDYPISKINILLPSPEMKEFIDSLRA